MLNLDEKRALSGRFHDAMDKLMAESPASVRPVLTNIIEDVTPDNIAYTFEAKHPDLEFAFNVGVKAKGTLDIAEDAASAMHEWFNDCPPERMRLKIEQWRNTLGHYKTFPISPACARDDTIEKLAEAAARADGTLEADVPLASRHSDYIGEAKRFSAMMKVWQARQAQYP